MRQKIFVLIAVLLWSVGRGTAQAPMNKQRVLPPTALTFLPNHSSLIYYNPERDLIEMLNIESGVTDSLKLPPRENLSSIHQIAVTHSGSRVIIEMPDVFGPRKNRSVVIGGPDTIWSFKTSLLCYSLPGKQLLWTLITPDLRYYEALLVSPDDRYLYGVVHMGRNQVIDLATGKISSSSSKLPNGNGRNFVQSPGGRFVIYWNKAGYKTFNARIGSRLHLWDLTQRKIIASRFISGKGVWAATFKGDEKCIFTGSYDGSLKEWSISDNKLIRLHKDYHSIYNLSYSGSPNKVLAVNSIGNDSLLVYSYPSMTTLFASRLPGDTYTIGGDPAVRFAFSNDGKYFAISGPNGRPQILTTDNWQRAR